MLDALGAARLPMATCGSLTLHLSRSGALENAGIALQPVYGFVYLPGSIIKGLVRSWVVALTLNFERIYYPHLRLGTAKTNEDIP